MRTPKSARGSRAAVQARQESALEPGRKIGYGERNQMSSIVSRFLQGTQIYEWSAASVSGV